MPAANTTKTAADLITRASDNWACAGITVTREHVWSPTVAGRSTRGVFTTIRLAGAACDDSDVIITHNDLTGALLIGHEEGKRYLVSAERAAVLVEARINVWIAKREVAKALIEAERAAFSAIHCDEEEAA